MVGIHSGYIFLPDFWIFDDISLFTIGAKSTKRYIYYR